MLRNILGPVFSTTFWWYFCFSFFLQGKRDFQKQKQKIQKLGPVFNTKRAYLGPVFNSTACMYVYIYMCVCVFMYCRVKLGPKLSFFSQSLVQVCFLYLFLFFCFNKSSSSAGRMRFFKKKKEDNNYHFYEGKPGPSMLRNILGPSFDSTF